MLKCIEQLKDVDVNNAFELIAISVIIIIVLAICMKAFNASAIEVVLLSEKDRVKRLSLLYVIMFIPFCAAIYYLSIDTLALVIYFIIVVPYWVWNLIRRCGKSKEKIIQKRNISSVLSLLWCFSVLDRIAKGIIQPFSGAILAALLETFFVGVFFLNKGVGDASYYVKIDNEKWYVFSRFEDSMLLCGDEKNIEKSSKTIIIELNTIIQNKLYFEKDKQ